MLISRKQLDSLARSELRSRRFREFQRIVTRLSCEFINMPLQKLDGAMQSAVALVGEYCDVFRASIWKFDWKKRSAQRLAGWACEGGAIPEIFVAPSLTGLDQLIESICRGDIYYAGDSDDVVRDNADALSKEPHSPFTVCVFPLMLDNGVIGCISLFANGRGRTLDKTEISMLRIFAGMISNVIRRRERETELQLHHENDRVILDSISEGVVMFDRGGGIININRHLAEKFGGTAEELIGTHISQFFPTEGNSQFMLNRQEKITRTYDTGIPAFFEDEKFGRTFSNRCFPIYKDGVVCAVAFFTSDITPQKNALAETTKRAESQARLRVMTDFFTNISHEFKTPLTLLFNAQKLVEDNVKNVRFAGKEHVDKYLGVMRQNTNRLLRLVGNLLDVTKLDSGFMQVNLQEIDTAGWLTTVVESVEAYAENRGIKVLTAIQPHFPALRTDVDKLERILLNLLSNSVKHTPCGGHIAVTLAGDEKTALLSVRDDGEGIPDDRKDIIFDRFKQVNTSLTRASEGSGIGLALCKQLTELLGGRIWFESRYGEGSVFYVELPVEGPPSGAKSGYLDGMDITRKAEMEFSDIQ